MAPDITREQVVEAVRDISEYERHIARPRSKSDLNMFTGGLDGPRAAELIVAGARARERLRYCRQVDDCMQGRMGRYDTLCVMESTPPLLQALDVPQMTWVHTQRHLKDELKTYRKKPGERMHRMRAADIKRMPELLAEPLAVIDDADLRRVIAILPATDKDGRIAIAPVKPYGFGTIDGREVEANAVLSVYGKVALERMLEDAAMDDRVCYLDLSRTERLMSCAGYRLPRACMNLDGIIHPSEACYNMGGWKADTKGLQRANDLDDILRFAESPVFKSDAQPRPYESYCPGR